MRKDPTEFRERFARWKLGELVYENGRSLPGYKGGKQSKAAHEEFVDQMGPLLYQELLRTNTPNIDTAYNHMLRQLGYESDYGRSPVARRQHNYGGYGWNGKTYTTFKDDKDFIEHYVKLMNNRYHKAVAADTVQAYSRALKDKGYYEDTYEHYTGQLGGMKSLNRYAALHRAKNADLYALPKEDPEIIQLMEARPQFVPQPVKMQPSVLTDYSIQTMTDPTIPAAINSKSSGDSPLYGGNDYSVRMPSIKEVMERLLFEGLPGYKKGKSGWNLMKPKQLEEQEERRDNTNVVVQQEIEPIKRDFIAEAQRKHTAETVGPDYRSSYQHKQAQAAKQYANLQYQKAKDDAKRAEGMEQMMKTISPSTYIEAATGLDLGAAGRLVTDAAAFGLPGLLKYGAAKVATSPIMHYVRYPIGKIRFGFDAQLPTLYRKVKSLPTIENGMIKISTPQNRFAFENGYGEESPLITNFTTDAPVRSHSAGNWDRGVTLAIPGKKLLGKNVISTRPSDTFTYGNDIQVNIGDVTAITGRQKEIDFLTNHGINTITSDKLKSKFAEDAVKYMLDIAKVRATYPRVFGQKGIVLLKPKTPIEDFSNYAAEVENASRDFFTSPTLKDYKFMDYVFRPKYTSETMPVYNVSSLLSLNQAPQLGEWVGEDTKRMYLLDASRWKNVMYDPSTPVESQFRQGLNIGLKPEYRK